MFLVIKRAVIMFHYISTDTMEASTCNIHAILITICFYLLLEYHKIIAPNNLIVLYLKEMVCRVFNHGISNYSVI